MAQAYVNFVRNNKLNDKQKSIGVQTGENNLNIVYHLPNNKVVRLYYYYIKIIIIK